MSSVLLGCHSIQLMYTEKERENVDGWIHSQLLSIVCSSFDWNHKENFEDDKRKQQWRLISIHPVHHWDIALDTCPRICFSLDMLLNQDIWISSMVRHGNRSMHRVTDNPLQERLDNVSVMFVKSHCHCRHPRPMNTLSPCYMIHDFRSAFQQMLIMKHYYNPTMRESNWRNEENVCYLRYRVGHQLGQ